MPKMSYVKFWGENVLYYKTKNHVSHKLNIFLSPTSVCAKRDIFPSLLPSEDIVSEELMKNFG